jgi:hypothetical protein
VRLEALGLPGQFLLVPALLRTAALGLEALAENGELLVAQAKHLDLLAGLAARQGRPCLGTQT